MRVQNIRGLINNLPLSLLSDLSFQECVLPLHFLNEQQKLAKLIYKVFLGILAQPNHFISQFDLSEDILRILEVWLKKDFNLAFFRPDFLIDEHSQIKICEINARSPINGFLFSELATYLKRNNPTVKFISGKRISEFNFFIDSLLFQYKKYGVLIIKEHQPGFDIHILNSHFDALNFPCFVIKLVDIPNYIDRINEYVVFFELTFNEISEIPLEFHEAFSETLVINDPRVTFLLHDKRFLKFLCDPSFLECYLMSSDATFLVDRIIPTFLKTSKNNMPFNFLEEKEKWVIKKSNLGKGEDINIGLEMSLDDWVDKFCKADAVNYILQRYIPQKRFYSENIDFQNGFFATGMMPCIGGSLYSIGLLRVSDSLPVNLSDGRTCFVFPRYA